MTTVSSELSPPAVAQPPAPDANLSLQDLQNLLIIVDLATQRGAFRGNELGQIGMVFDRVSQFLKATLPPAEENPAPQPAPQPMAPAPVMQPMAPQPMTPMTPPFVPKVGS
jgi:hypothetical protein